MTRELKEIARKEAPVLVKELIRFATIAESEAVRVATIKEQDRGRDQGACPRVRPPWPSSSSLGLL
jgi:hypothetical protein